VSVLLLCVGAILLIAPSSRARVVRKTRGPGVDAPTAAAAVAAVGVVALVGRWWGLPLGLAAGWFSRRLLQRLAAAQTAEREALLRQAPDAVDCLASCLAAGAPLWTGMTVTADAFGEPVAGLFRRCSARHRLGAGYPLTFSEFLDDPELAPVGRVLLRSVESGAALTTALISCVEQLRAQRGAELERRARAVGVKAVLPLAVCFLPAFVLLAVVPIVGSLVMDLF